MFAGMPRVARNARWSIVGLRRASGRKNGLRGRVFRRPSLSRCNGLLHCFEGEVDRDEAIDGAIRNSLAIPTSDGTSTGRLLMRRGLASTLLQVEPLVNEL